MLHLQFFLLLVSQGSFAGVHREDFSAYVCAVVHEECEVAVAASQSRQHGSQRLLQTPGTPPAVTPGTAVVRRNSASFNSAPLADGASRNPQPARRIQPTALASDLVSSGHPAETGAAVPGPSRAQSAHFGAPPHPADAVDEREALRLLRQAKGPVRALSVSEVESDPFRVALSPAPPSQQLLHSRVVAQEQQQLPQREQQTQGQLRQHHPPSDARAIPGAPPSRGSSEGPGQPPVAIVPDASAQRAAAACDNAPAGPFAGAAAACPLIPADGDLSSPQPQTRLQALRPGAALDITSRAAEGSSPDGAVLSAPAELSRHAEVAAALYAAVLVHGMAPSLASEILFLCRLLSLSVGANGTAQARTPGSGADRAERGGSSSFTQSSSYLPVGSPEYSLRTAGQHGQQSQQLALPPQPRPHSLDLACAEAAGSFAAAALVAAAPLLASLPPILLTNLQKCRALSSTSPEVCVVVTS